MFWEIVEDFETPVCFLNSWLVLIWQLLFADCAEQRRDVLFRVNTFYLVNIHWRLSGQKCSENVLKCKRESTRGTRDLIPGRFIHETIFHAWIFWKINTAKNPSHEMSFWKDYFNSKHSILSCLDDLLPEMCRHSLNISNSITTNDFRSFPYKRMQSSLECASSWVLLFCSVLL